MEAKAFRLLIYLLSVAKGGGECIPGYKAMREAMRGSPEEKGCNNTVRRALTVLQKAGWFHHTKRTNGLMRIYLHVPLRFRPVPKKHVQIALFPKQTKL